MIFFCLDRFGPGFIPFLDKQIRSLGFLEGFERVRSLVLVEEPGFERVRSLTCQVRSSSKSVIFGFDPTLVYCILTEFAVLQTQ